MNIFINCYSTINVIENDSNLWVFIFKLEKVIHGG